MVTGRSEGEFTLADTPFTQSDIQTSPPSDISPFEEEEWLANALSELNNSWVDLMNTELTLVNNLVNLGEIVWPAIPILVWAIAMWEGYYLVKGRDDDALRSLTNLADSLTAPITQSRNSGSVALSLIHI